MLRNLSGPTYGIVSWEIFLDLEKLGLASGELTLDLCTARLPAMDNIFFHKK